MLTWVEGILIVLILIGTGIILVSKSIVHGLYGLALVLVVLSGYYVILSALFLATIQILIYAGGVVILLAFGIMMSTQKSIESFSRPKNVIFSGFFSVALFFGLSYLIKRNESLLITHPLFENNEVNEITRHPVEQIGFLFFTEHLVAFELIGFLLLTVLVGAAYLAKNADKNE